MSARRLIDLLKVMILDDERLVRDLLKACIDWHELGMYIAAESGSALEGLELVDKVKPDIIFTDICMPVMDGLEFSRRVLEKHPDIKIIILTGHDEFEYAQNSIKLGIVDFLLKPINDDEIRETALTVKEKLLSERNRTEDYERLKEQLRQNMPYLREKFLNELVQGYVSSDTVKEKAQYFDIPLPEDIFQVAVLELLCEGQELTDEEGRLILNMHCMAQLRAFFEGKGVSIFPDNRERIVILMYDKDIDAYECCESIRQMLVDRLSCSFCIGIGNMYDNIDNLYLSYYEACDALRYRFAAGPNQVISFSDICPSDDQKDQWDCEVMDNYCFYLKSGLKEKAQELVSAVFSELRSIPSCEETVRVLACNFTANALNVLLQLGIKQQEVFKEGVQPFESIFKLSSLAETEAHINEISAIVAEAAGRLQGKKARKLISDVKEYINRSYSSPDLTLSSVARKFYINPSYLSRIFKEEIGMTFIDYLTKLRMEKSIRLFHETDKKAYQIAAEVGINDPQYFSVCFKKYTGLSVNDFKKGKIQ